MDNFTVTHLSEEGNIWKIFIYSAVFQIKSNSGKRLKYSKKINTNWILCPVHCDMLVCANVT